MSGTNEALMRLGASTAEAIAKVLDNLCPGEVERGEVSVLNPDTNPFATLEVPAVAVSVAYIDGVTGGNVFFMTATGARRLAASMMGAPAADDGGAGELSVLELSAVAEAANQMMAAAASATSVVLGQDVEIAPPETRIFHRLSEALEAYEAAPHGTRATFRVCDEPCRLVQLVPNAFIVRMTRAFDELGVEHVSGGSSVIARDAARGEADTEVALEEALRDIRVRVWAELGRTRVPLGDAPAMAPGTVLELDRKADDPVDLYVNGLRFGCGRLVVADDGEWALRLDEVAGAGARASSPSAEADGARTTSSTDPTDTQEGAVP